MADDRIDTLIDPLIDDVAREMTTAPDDAGFARRVSRRIAEAGEPRAGWRTAFRPWVLVPIAAAMVLAVLVETNRSVRLKPDATPDATPGATPIETVRLTFDSAQVTPSGSRGVKADPTYIVPIADAPAPAVNPIEINALDVPPLVAMDEIFISPIAIDRIEIAEMP